MKEVPKIRLPPNHIMILIVLLIGISMSSVSASKFSSSFSMRNSKSPKLPHQQKLQSNGKSNRKIPEIVKIFENPDPNDGFESLRSFSRGMTEGMFSTRLYNTSIALTSALLSFQLPSNDDSEETTVNMANQTIFGLFGMLTSILIFALPVLLTGQIFNPNARSLGDEGFISKLLKKEPLARFIENGFPQKIGLEPEKCLQKTICEAHRAPHNKKYGMLAIPFQMFYPPMSNEKDQSRATSFQEAAYIGKYTENKCAKKYNCFFDVLDLGRYLLDWYQYHNGGVDDSKPQ